LPSRCLTENSMHTWSFLYGTFTGIAAGIRTAGSIRAAFSERYEICCLAAEF
jgi:hypothetical protein